MFYVEILAILGIHTARLVNQIKGYFMSKKTKKKKKPEKNKKIVECIDCGVKTDNFYANSINSGIVHRCVDCHEKWVIRSVRNDSRFSDMEDGQKS